MVFLISSNATEIKELYPFHPLIPLLNEKNVGMKAQLPSISANNCASLFSNLPLRNSSFNKCLGTKHSH